MKQLRAIVGKPHMQLPTHTFACGVCCCMLPSGPAAYCHPQVQMASSASSSSDPSTHDAVLFVGYPCVHRSPLSQGLWAKVVGSKGDNSGPNLLECPPGEQQDALAISFSLVSVESTGSAPAAAASSTGKPAAAAGAPVVTLQILQAGRRRFTPFSAVQHLKLSKAHADEKEQETLAAQAFATAAQLRAANRKLFNEQVVVLPHIACVNDVTLSDNARRQHCCSGCTVTLIMTAS